MTNLAMIERRRACGGLVWTPGNLSGVAAWWHADDLTGLGNGAAVTTWTDKIGALAATSATGPTVATGSLNGRTGLTFNGSSQSLTTNGLGAIPATGPVTVVVIANNTGGGQLATISSSSGHGYALSVANSSPYRYNLSTVGVANNFGARCSMQLPELFVGSLSAGPSVVPTFQFAGVADTLPPTTINSGANTVYIGQWYTASGFYNGTMYDLILVNGVIGAGDLAKLRAWAAQTYGTSIPTATHNAPASVNVAGVDHTGAAVTDAIELGVVHNPAGIFGHKYWLAFAPYDAGTSDENPCINFSDDGNTWASTGVTNPLVPYPGGGTAGNNSDPSLLDNVTRDGLLYLYYHVENSSTGPGNGVYALTYDGTSWTSHGKILTPPSNGAYECPNVCYDPTSGLYWLYTMTFSPTLPVVYRQTSASPLGPWSAQAQVMIPTLPSVFGPWHISAPVKIGGKWVWCFSDSYSGFTTAQNLWLASSTDGLTFTVGPAPLTLPGPSSTAWDAPSIYRPAIQDAQDGQNLLLWYVAGSGAAGIGANHMSQMVTIPQSLIP